MQGFLNSSLEDFSKEQARLWFTGAKQHSATILCAKDSSFESSYVILRKDITVKQAYAEASLLIKEKFLQGVSEVTFTWETLFYLSEILDGDSLVSLVAERALLVVYYTKEITRCWVAKINSTDESLSDWVLSDLGIQELLNLGLIADSWRWN